MCKLNINLLQLWLRIADFFPCLLESCSVNNKTEFILCSFLFTWNSWKTVFARYHLRISFKDRSWYRGIISKDRDKEEVSSQGQEQGWGLTRRRHWQKREKQGCQGQTGCGGCHRHLCSAALYLKPHHQDKMRGRMNKHNWRC